MFFFINGLASFKEAINAVYPQAQIQRCVIYMLRNSFKYANYQDLKKFPSDFKAVYNASNCFFRFSDDIRRIMYTTNIIEGLNRQYRKVTKAKSVLPSETTLEKILYSSSQNVVKKWTHRYRNWDQVQLILLCGEQITQYL